MLKPTLLQISYTFWTSSPSKKLPPGIAHLGASLFAPNVFESMWRCVNEASNVHGGYARICSIPKKIEKQNPALNQFVMNYIFRIPLNLFGDYISDTTDITQNGQTIERCFYWEWHLFSGRSFTLCFPGPAPLPHILSSFWTLIPQSTRQNPPSNPKYLMLAFGCKNNGSV